MKRRETCILQSFKSSVVSLVCATVFVGQVNAAEPLTREECELIEAYEKTDDLSFVDRFSEMTHGRGLCSDGGLDCYVPLHKRVEDYYLVIRGADHFSTDEIAKVAQDALGKNLVQLSSVTELRVLLSKPINSRNFVHLVFVDKDLAVNEFDEYVDAWIAPLNIAGSLEKQTQILTYFEEFIETDAPCLVVDHLRPHGRIQGSQIWIRADLDETRTRQCIAEEFYNSLGLTGSVELGSIFDNFFSHSEGDIELSKFDLLMLKILYRDELKPGIEIEETKKVVNRIVAEECTAK